MRQRWWGSGGFSNEPIPALSWWSTLASAFAVMVIQISLLPPSYAGDAADRHIIGFSSDGSAFAFEEFGRQDGSGFPYSNIYIIDTEKNEWVDGSPFRSIITREDAEVREAREVVLQEANFLLAKLGIQNGRKGRLLASNPITEISADPDRVKVVPHPSYPAFNEPIQFAIREFPLEDARCRSFGQEKTLGIALRVRVGDRAPEPLYRDKKIPESRGCPRDYAISDVILYEPRKDEEVYLLLISVMRLGFEGADRRFIAQVYRR